MLMFLNRIVYYCEQVMPKFPRMNSWVSRRVRSNQFHLLWWLSMFLVLSCCCSEWWFRPSVTPDVHTTNIWKQIAAHYSFFSQNLLYRGIPVWNDIMDWWFPTSWGLLCFESMKRSSPLDTRFSCFFEMSFLGVVLKDEISSIILLETPHEIFWHWLLIHPIVMQCAYPWGELSVSVNKSCQSFPCMKSWLSPRVRTNQSKHYLMTLTNFWYSVAVAQSDDFVLPWLLMFVPPRSENKLKLVSVFFPKICCLVEFQFELMLWIVGFRLRTSLFWINANVFLFGYQTFVFLCVEFPRCSFNYLNS